METKKWYVGQQVWDKTVSDEAGQIISINDVQIVAKFFRNQWAYSLNGELIIVGRNRPTLSTTPYEIKMEGFSQEIEEELPKKGTIVWVRDNEINKWSITHFLKKEDGKYFCSIKNDSAVQLSWKQLTTKNPYEIKEDREPQIGDMVFAWDNEIINTVVCGELENIYSAHLYPFALKGGFSHKHCSLKNPLIK